MTNINNTSEPSSKTAPILPQNNEAKLVEPHSNTIDKSKFEKVSQNIQSFISPLNALYLFPLVLSAVLDFLSPYGNYLSIFAVLSIILLLVSGIAYKFKTPKWITVAVVFYCIFGSFVLCTSAIANLKYKDTGGFLANYVPKIKTWQDAYLVSIKKDTTDILEKTRELDNKLNQTNFLLTQVMSNMRPQYEKVLAEEIPAYDSLNKNQKDALVYFSSKVGTNGIRRYKKLLASVNDYAKSPTLETKNLIVERTQYIVKVNGKIIEDEKTRLYALALFFEPQTFDYLLGNSNGQPQANSAILPLFNINPTQPALNQVKDPLGDFIRDLTSKGEKVSEEVVIPKTEAISQAPQKPNRPKNNRGSYLPNF